MTKTAQKSRSKGNAVAKTKKSKGSSTASSDSPETPQKWSEGNSDASDHKHERVRAFTFTSFNTNEPEFINCMKYLAYAQETCPTTQKLHWQGFVYFNDGKTIKAASKALGKVHVEIMRGSFEDNEAYCSKQGRLITKGTKPDQGKRTDLKDLRDQIMTGKRVEEILMDDPYTYHQYGRTLEKIETLAQRRTFRTQMTTCDWLYGPTGSGKSHHALKDYSPDTHYLVNLTDGGWWEGYKGQPYVVIQEYRGTGITFAELLQLIDKWPYNVNRRCREPMPFTSQHIFITSPMHPREVFTDLQQHDSIAQLLRRIRIIHVSTGAIQEPLST
jgi:hypothetical protein